MWILRSVCWLGVSLSLSWSVFLCMSYLVISFVKQIVLIQDAYVVTVYELYGYLSLVKRSHHSIHGQKELIIGYPYTVTYGYLLGNWDTYISLIYRYPYGYLYITTYLPGVTLRVS